MRTLARLLPAILVAALALAAAPARAGGWLFEGSVGSGFRFQPSPVERVPTNVMLTTGYGIPMVKAELGVVGNLGDVKHRKFDLDIRPMLVVSPPLIPLYARAIAGVGGLLDKPTHLVWGGALGVSIGALGVGGFAEAGALSRRINVYDDRGVATKKDVWVAEGRLGVYFH